MIYTIGPNQNSYFNKNVKIAFQGNFGNECVSKAIQESGFTTDAIMPKLKGTFGLNKEKVMDVLESFVNSVKNLSATNKNTNKRIYTLESEVAEFPNKLNEAIAKTRQEMRNSYAASINSMKEKLAQAEKEAKEAKQFAEKYKPVVDVKSVDEIETVMPKQAIQTIDEIIENKISARKSMFEFLMTGKGQEDALKQIERSAVLYKANQEGTTNIPEVSSKLSEFRKQNMYIGHPLNLTINMIKEALKGSNEGSYIMNYTVQQQVKKNAMAILNPMTNEKIDELSIELVNKKLDAALKDVIDFHRNYSRGVEKLTKDFKGKIEFNPMNFDRNAIGAKSGREQLTFQQIANRGEVSW